MLEMVPQAADTGEMKSGLIRSEGDSFLNGAQGHTFTEECIFHPSEFYPSWTMEAATDSLKSILQICAGWQSIQRPADNMVIP